MIGFIGGGNMAEAIIKGMIKDQGFRIQDITVAEPIEERRKYLENEHGVKTAASNTEVVSVSDLLILAVKPQNMDDVLIEIDAATAENKTFVSIAAGITLSYLQSKLKTGRIIRVMPNTPAITGNGMSVMAAAGFLPEDVMDEVKRIFGTVGKVVVMPEEKMNAVTALSGSGPAFFALFTEAIIKAGERIGLDADEAVLLAVQTALGTARLLDTGMPAEDLRKMVTSPGGTTAAGLMVFEKRDLKGIVEEALVAARNRSEELGRRK